MIREQPRYDDPKGYDERHQTVLDSYLHKLWHPFIVEKTRKLSPNRTVLDLGCGTCEYTQHIKYAKMRIGIDTSRDMLEYGAKKLNGENTLLIQGDAHHIPLKSNSVDLIICIGILQYVELESVLKECGRILNYNSKFLIVTFNKWNIFNSLIRYKNCLFAKEYLKKERTLYELKKALEKTNFRIIEDNSFGMIFYVPSYLQRYGPYLWKFLDILWKPFQKSIPLGIFLYVEAEKYKSEE